MSIGWWENFYNLNNICDSKGVTRPRQDYDSQAVSMCTEMHTYTSEWHPHRSDSEAERPPPSSADVNLLMYLHSPTDCMRN
jgi:hypothetical protein